MSKDTSELDPITRPTQQSRMAMYVLGGALLFIVAASGTLAMLLHAPAPSESADTMAGQGRQSVQDRVALQADLAADRAKYGTHLTRHIASPEEMPQFPVPNGARQILYSSGNLRLRAWVSDDPGDQKRHPAVVYLHGNYCFEPRHWDTIQACRDAGYVTMTPMVRGENTNDGDFEFFFGEVDDVIAAGRELASLPYVDPSRVYLAGHSCGGSLTMLASMMPNPYAAAAAISGSTDQFYVSQWPDPTPPIFDVHDFREYRLRSPAHYAGSIRCPLYLFVGDKENWAIGMNQQLAKDAHAAGKPCEFFLMPGDHGTAKAPSIRKSISLFQQHPKPQ